MLVLRKCKHIRIWVYGLLKIIFLIGGLKRFFFFTWGVAWQFLQVASFLIKKILVFSRTMILRRIIFRLLKLWNIGLRKRWFILTRDTRLIHTQSRQFGISISSWYFDASWPLLATRRNYCVLSALFPVNIEFIIQLTLNILITLVCEIWRRLRGKLFVS